MFDGKKCVIVVIAMPQNKHTISSSIQTKTTILKMNTNLPTILLLLSLFQTSFNPLQRDRECRAALA